MSAPRRWLELGVRRGGAPDLEPLLAEALVALGGRAVLEAGDLFITHVEEPEELEAFLHRARGVFAELLGPVPVELTTRWVDHEDWAETWKRGLSPRRIGGCLVVTTTWHPVDPQPGDIVLVIDPGMAFGTAEHGTTRGCLRLLERAVEPGQRVLDVGAGSGILGIAAARLGADGVLALEGDPLATEALAENVALNGVTDLVRWEERWADAALLAGLAPCDGVVANIESGILRSLMSGFAAALRPGGWLILSGILAHEWAGIRAAAEGAGFAFVDLDADGEWRSGLFTRSGAEGATDGV
jgi:ribosomal protein L11 methyltransferase